MAEEDNDLDLDLGELDQNIEKKNKVEQRIKDLSNKVKLTSEERDEKDRLLKESEEQLVAATKERDFFASFTDTTAKYPGANEFKDIIKEKVMAGYDVEDATVAVLAREGKLTIPEPVVDKENPAGGSAATQPIAGSQKSLSEMTQEERRAAIVEAEAKGDISIN